MGISRKRVFSVGAIMAAMLVLPAAWGQACPTPNWVTGPTIWASEDSIKVLQGNAASSNQPTIPTYMNAGEFDPQGYPLHPQPLTQLNPVWSCPAGQPAVSIAGAGRETVAFQLLITAGTTTSLAGVSVSISPLTGPGTTITSDDTQSSAVTRYLEGYIPETYAGPGNGVMLAATGNFPDPLIPFYDPYDAGNGPVATPFNVGAATTQGVWVDVAIPANQAAGVYTGTITVTGTGVGTVTYPLSLTVWNGNLPRFNDPTEPGMLKAWVPLYEGELQGAEGFKCLYDTNFKVTLAACPGGANAADLTMIQKYQVMAHNYDFDTQVDGVGPSLTPFAGTVPSPTALTSIDWTNWDQMNGPALTPGGLFKDGTNMRVIDAPFSAGGGPWNDGFYKTGSTAWNNYSYDINTLPPAGLLSLYKSYASLISQHFTSNQQNNGWATNSEILSYTFDETYDKLQSMPVLYTAIDLYSQALNQANAANNWVNPVRGFLTASPACIPGATLGIDSGAICTAQEGLSYPEIGGIPDSWILDWSPDGQFNEPGPSTDNPDFTMNGVASHSTAPVPIEKWVYGSGDPFLASTGINYEALAYRSWFWVAAKYGLDQTSPSSGVPNPAPTPGGVFNFAANYWAIGDDGTPSTDTDCSTSPYFNGGGNWNGNGYFFYPGNEVGCYYQSNSGGDPVGKTILTANPVANAGCSTTDFDICNGISGPVSSINMEEWRRGYQDYMYIYLLRKKDPATATSVINSMGGGGMTTWNALNWQAIDPEDIISGVFPQMPGVDYSGTCTAPSLGLPNGPTGVNGCPGEWSHNPNHYEEARVVMAQNLGFASTDSAPTVTAISPSTGAAAGGTSVTITGTNFTNATVVEFGNAPAASLTVNSATEIIAVSPAGTGTVDLTVVTPNGTSATSSVDQFTYPAVTPSTPTLTAISPATGSAGGGTTVTITGTGFTGATAVNFGGTAGTSVTVVSDTQITAVSPAGSGTVDVTVITPNGTTAINAADQFTYPAGSYTIVASPSSVTIAAGATGAATLTLTPTAGYTGTVNLTCTNLPAYSTCVFAQPNSQAGGTVMLGGDTPSTVNLTIKTNVAPTAAMSPPHHPSNSMLPVLAFCFPGGLIGLAVLSRRKNLLGNQRRLLQIGLFVLMTGAMVGMIAGCSDSGSSTTPTNPNTTPAGTSTVTVLSTATSGTTGLSQSATLTVTITQ